VLILRRYRFLACGINMGSFRNPEHPLCMLLFFSIGVPSILFFRPAGIFDD
jgi:hypothetical protein